MVHLRSSKSPALAVVKHTKMGASVSCVRECVRKAVTNPSGEGCKVFASESKVTTWHQLFIKKKKERKEERMNEDRVFCFFPFLKKRGCVICWLNHP